MSRIFLSRWPVLLLALPILQACQDQPQETVTDGPPIVSTVKAAQRSLVTTITATGTVTPRRAAMVYAQTPGLILTELLVEEGQMVETGDLLARLSSERQRAELSGARGELQRAHQALTRAEALKKTGTMAGSAYDSAIASHSEAQARVHTLEIDLERTAIRAPVSGLVQRRSIEIGEVADGKPLFEIVAEGELEVVADLSESAWRQTRTAQSAIIVLADGRKLLGQVRRRSGALDSQTRLGRVWISMQGLPKDIVSGTGASVSLTIGHGDRLSVPGSSLLFDQQGAYVFVVADGKAARRNISLGAQNGTLAEVTTGLKPGDAVVARAGSLLRDGDPVRTDTTTRVGSVVR